MLTLLLVLVFVALVLLFFLGPVSINDETYRKTPPQKPVLTIENEKGEKFNVYIRYK